MDEPPYFTNFPGTLSIAENVSYPEIIYNLTAIDPDGDNFEFVLTQETPGLSIFSVAKSGKDIFFLSM